MNVCIRVDASSNIGLGHAKRCLALAEGLVSNGVPVTVLYHQMPSVMVHEYESKKIRCQSLSIGTWAESSDADATLSRLNTDSDVTVLIVDHYKLGIEWEKRVRPGVEKMVVIDDWGDRPHDCDILIDQNLCEDPEERYKNILPANCTRLIGPEYALLNQEIVQLKAQRRPSNKALISFGGSYEPEVKKVIQAISTCQDDWEWQLILGMISDEAYEDVMRLMPKNIEVFRYVNNMHEFLCEAALCIGAGGSSNWERFYLGIPSIICAVSEDQVPVARTIGLYDAAKVMPNASVSSSAEYKACIEGMTKSKLNYYSEKASNLIDGKGVSRICQTIQTLDAS